STGLPICRISSSRFFAVVLIDGVPRGGEPRIFVRGIPTVKAGSLIGGICAVYARFTVDRASQQTALDPKLTEMDPVAHDRPPLRHPDPMDTQLARATVSIREMILRGRLRPGQRVAEAMLADMLQMSRTPVRQALPVLAKEGLLVESGTRGYVVRTFTRS